MFAMVATIVARRVGTPPPSRSLMNAVAVATVTPTAAPVSTRASRSPGSDIQTMSTAAAIIAITTPGISTVRRPYQSETWPARTRLAMSPAAYTA
jgi:hypothetical protein